jgi:DNA-binding transcriptional LysR family regulator
MQRGHLDDLLAFVAVARERSFTRAAAKLAVSQSALSHTLRELEARLGVRLLTRTTRSIAPTQAGERLLNSVGPRLEEIEASWRRSASCATNPPASFASPPPNMPPTPSCCRNLPSSCARIRRSRSRLSSTTA